MFSFSRLHHQLSAKPWIIALSISLALILWMGSGALKAEPEQQSAKPEVALPKVQVTLMRAVPVERAITLYGRTEPNRKAELKAETAGKVVELLAKRGDYVQQGEPLVRLEMNERQQQLAQAKALYAQREIEFQGAKKLSSQGFSGKARLAEAQAQLEGAKAQVAQLELDIQNTLIKAPFTGIFNERMVEVGDYLGVGDPIAVMYDIDPIVVRADAGQQDVTLLKRGLEGTARFASGELHKGQVRYLSKVADPGTNTFRVELTLANPEHALFAGLSAELELPLTSSEAIKVTPALLSLDEEGNLGVKTVVDSRVLFNPIQLVKADKDGVWLGGFSGEVNVITLGQGFVRPGDLVDVVYANQAR